MSTDQPSTSASSPPPLDEENRNLIFQDAWFDTMVGNKSLREWILDNDLSNFDVLELLSWKDDSALDTFGSMWWYIFFWMFTSTLLVHIVAAIVSGICLNRHKYSPCIALFIVLQGIAMPLTLGAITCAVIAWTCYNSTTKLPPFYAFVLGVGHTIVYCIMAFSKVLATL